MNKPSALRQPSRKSIATRLKWQQQFGRTAGIGIAAVGVLSGTRAQREVFQFVETHAAEVSVDSHVL